VAADADETLRQRNFGRLGQINDFRDIGEVIARKSDQVRMVTERLNHKNQRIEPVRPENGSIAMSGFLD